MSASVDPAGTADERYDTSTDAIEAVACANYQSFQETIDLFAAENPVDRTEIRNALADWVDDGLQSVVDDYDIPVELIVDARDACRRVAKSQYAEHYRRKK